MYKKVILGGLCFWMTAAGAETISLEYKGFFERLTRVQQGNYQLVELAFSVPVTPDCQLQNGNISSEKFSTPLSYTESQRLFIPYDASLKEQRALVNLTFAGSAQGCAIAMQVRAKQTLLQYEGERLRQISAEMDNLLGAMQGFPMRYFTAPIAGLHFEFPADAVVDVTLNGRTQVSQGTWRIAAADVAALESLNFSQPPLVLSPWVK
ncbi:MAG: DUF2987 domain-containing protein [Shewanella sp.]